MPRSIPQTRFSKGEVSPSFFGRSDVVTYHEGLAEATNVYIKPTGGAIKRPGTRFIAPLPFDPGNVKLFEFKFRERDQYVMVIVAGHTVGSVNHGARIYFFRNGIAVLEGASNSVATFTYNGDSRFNSIDFDTYDFTSAAAISSLPQDSVFQSIAGSVSDSNVFIFHRANHGLDDGQLIQTSNDTQPYSLANQIFKVKKLSDHHFLIEDFNFQKQNYITSDNKTSFTFKFRQLYSINLGYTSWIKGAEVNEVHVSQNADTVTFTHLNYQPLNIQRLAHNNWRNWFSGVQDREVNFPDLSVISGSVADNDSTGEQVNLYRYAVTAVNLDNNEESLPARASEDFTFKMVPNPNGRNNSIGTVVDSMLDTNVTEVHADVTTWSNYSPYTTYATRNDLPDTSQADITGTIAYLIDENQFVRATSSSETTGTGISRTTTQTTCVAGTPGACGAPQGQGTGWTLEGSVVEDCSRGTDTETATTNTSCTEPTPACSTAEPAGEGWSLVSGTAAGCGSATVETSTTNTACAATAPACTTATPNGNGWTKTGESEVECTAAETNTETSQTETACAVSSPACSTVEPAGNGWTLSSSEEAECVAAKFKDETATTKTACAATAPACTTATPAGDGWTTTSETEGNCTSTETRQTETACVSTAVPACSTVRPNGNGWTLDSQESEECVAAATSTTNRTTETACNSTTPACSTASPGAGWTAEGSTVVECTAATTREEVASTETACGTTTPACSTNTPDGSGWAVSVASVVECSARSSRVETDSTTTSCATSAPSCGSRGGWTLASSTTSQCSAATYRTETSSTQTSCTSGTPSSCSRGGWTLSGSSTSQCTPAGSRVETTSRTTACGQSPGCPRLSGWTLTGSSRSTSGCPTVFQGQTVKLICSYRRTVTTPATNRRNCNWSRRVLASSSTHKRNCNWTRTVVTPATNKRSCSWERSVPVPATNKRSCDWSKTTVTPATNKRVCNWERTVSGTKQHTCVWARSVQTAAATNKKICNWEKTTTTAATNKRTCNWRRTVASTRTQRTCKWTRDVTIPGSRRVCTWRRGTPIVTFFKNTYADVAIDGFVGQFATDNDAEAFITKLNDYAYVTSLNTFRKADAATFNTTTLPISGTDIQNKYRWIQSNGLIFFDNRLYAYEYITGYRIQIHGLRFTGNKTVQLSYFFTDVKTKIEADSATDKVQDIDTLTPSHVDLQWTPVTNIEGDFVYNIYRSRPNGSELYLLDTVQSTVYVDYPAAPRDNQHYQTLDFSRLAPSLLGVFSDDTPSVVSYFNQRKIFANTLERPDTIYFSAINNFTDFQAGVNADDSIHLTLASDKISPIQSIVPLRDLYVFTLDAVWKITPVADEAFTASNIKAIKVDSEGSAENILPIPVDDDIIYVTNDRKNIKIVTDETKDELFNSFSLTELARHLFEDYQIVNWAYNRERNMLVVLRNDGQALCMTFYRDHDVLAWTKWETLGRFLDVLVAPERDGFYFLVQRDSLLCLEHMVFTEDRDRFDKMHSLHRLDCSTRIAGTDTNIDTLAWSSTDNTAIVSFNPVDNSNPLDIATRTGVPLRSATHSLFDEDNYSLTDIYFLIKGLEVKASYDSYFVRVMNDRLGEKLIFGYGLSGADITTLGLVAANTNLKLDTTQFDPPLVSEDLANILNTGRLIKAYPLASGMCRFFATPEGTKRLNYTDVGVLANNNYTTVTPDITNIIDLGVSNAYHSQVGIPFTATVKTLPVENADLTPDIKNKPVNVTVKVNDSGTFQYHVEDDFVQRFDVDGLTSEALIGDVLSDWAVDKQLTITSPWAFPLEILSITLDTSTGDIRKR